MTYNSDLNWDILRCFHIASENKNFKIASSILGITPITLKSNILHLESIIGEKVFLRSNKDYMFTTLTRAGEDLKRKTSAINDLIKKMDSGVSSVYRNEEDTLISIFTTQGISGFILPNIVLDFHKKYPMIRLQIEATNNPIKEVLVNQIQIREDFSPQKTLVKEKILDIHPKFYASKDYVLKNGNPKTFNDLQNHNILFSMSSLGSKHNFTEKYFIKPYILSNSFQLSFQMCNEGLGIMCIPNILNKEHKLVPVLEEEKLEMETVYLGTNENEEENGPIKKLLEVIRTHHQHY